MPHVQHALTVDLEEWFHGIELPQESWPDSSRLEVGLDRLMSLLDEHDIRATFFVLGAVAERFPGRIAELAAQGHEVGSHGQGHEFVYKQTPGAFREDIRRSKGAIGNATGEAPRGYRAPYFSITEDSRWALDILAEEGFAYDSSIFPVHNDRYGIPGAPSIPHRVGAGDTSMMECPMTPFKLLGVDLPFAGGAYLRILPWWVQSLVWRSATRRGMNVVSYIHPWELDPEHPRIPLRRRVAATHYARLHLTQRRLDRLFSKYRFGRIDDIVKL